MRTTALVMVACAVGAQAFVGTPVKQPKACATTRGHSQPLNMAVIDTTRPLKASTRPGKEKVVAEVSSLLAKSSMVFSLPSSDITANQVVALRKGLPDGCTAKVVKNKLMRIACQGSPFEELTEVTTGENFWMFVEGEENLAEPIKYVAEFSKQFDKDASWGGSPFKAGVFAGELLDGPGVVAISKLPTKQELMQRLAVAINSVPTKIGRSINLVPTKVGRAVKLAFAPEEDADEEAPAEA